MVGNVKPTVASGAFGAEKCRSCKMERFFVLKCTCGGVKKPFGKDPILMNRRDELHGCCRHFPKFHKFEKSGADEIVLCTPTRKKVSHAGVVSEESSEDLSGTVDTLESDGWFEETEEMEIELPTENLMQFFIDV